MESAAHVLQAPANDSGASLRLVLSVTDPEVVHELALREEGPARDAYAKQALRLGVIALRQASGALDAQSIQRESDRMLASVREALSSHTSETKAALARLLGGYLDPSSGSLPQRLERLTKRDGEIETLLSKHLDGDRSTIAQTLARKVGEQSALFKLLSPTEAGGLVAILSRGIEQALEGQRDELLRRLAPVLEETRTSVGKHLTLDDPDSPLRRLRDELMGAVASFGESSTRFQSDVRATLEAFRVRREEAARSSAHGHTFEYAAGEMLQAEAAGCGDVCERLSGTPGREGRKTGDYVLTLSPESAAPGTKIVFECKAEKGYTEAEALEELALARKNREAQAGVFVVARESAKEGFTPFRRVGMDVLVVWDAEDSGTDVYLKAAVSIARALVVEQHRAIDRSEGDLRELEQSIGAIERLVTTVESIAHDARNIVKKGNKIGKAAEGVKERLVEEVERLKGVAGGTGQRDAKASGNANALRPLGGEARPHGH
ncbi:MAG TPA: restriction endonuclease [Polyangiaceae bacterium]|nr:restriction endonuclease [Polyangiaceae bacterium]